MHIRGLPAQTIQRRADSVLAGSGNDTVSLGDGEDSVFGQSGADTVDGGDGDDAPNAAAARFLIAELLPLMRKENRACRLVLVGSMPTKAMLDAARSDDQVIVTSGKKPERYTDIRKLLEYKNLDVVTIATPNHWHALATIWAPATPRSSL